MARKKRQFIDDADSDSSVASGAEDFDENDPDLREERALFEDPYKRGKRRRFGDDSDEEEPEVRRKNDWTKAPAFVSQQKVEPDKSMDVDEEMNADAQEQESNASEQLSDNDDNESEEGLGLGASPFMKGGIGSFRNGSSSKSGLSGFTRGGIGSSQKEDDEPKSAFSGFTRGGIGSSQKEDDEPKSAFSGFTRGGIGSSKQEDDQPKSPFSSFARGGVGSSKQDPELEPSTSAMPDSLPVAFGVTRTPRAFVRNNSDSPGSSRPITPSLSAAERAHFNRLEGSFGAKMLAKMGWVAGTGLGTSGEGRVNPVETKLRKRGMGLAFGGFTERTEQEKAEARRRGEVVSEDEDEKPGKKGRGKASGNKEMSDAWKRPRKVKVKIEHKSYEEILAEAGEEAPSSSGLGQIIDATGATPREVSSLAEVSLSSWTPSSDSTRIPEVRHNLRLIVESSKNDLDGLAREARTLEERKKWIRQEDVRLRKKLEEEAELIARLQQVHVVVDDINIQAKQLASSYEASLEPLAPSFDKLLGQFPKEFERYRLDEIVVAAIAPISRRMLATWKPLEEPSFMIPTFQLWRRALKVNPEVKVETGVQVYGANTIVSTVPTEKPMLPFESWLWHAWLPKVRSVINNDWLPEDPLPIIRLYEAWSNFLPPFIRDNFFDQLVLPKVHKAVADWNPKKQTNSLHSLIVPWLPYVGLRADEVLGEVKRRVTGLMRAWKPSDDIANDILVWKEVFDSEEWEGLLLKCIVPKLGATLREDFQVNPANQDMKPLQQVLLWSAILRPTIFSQLIESQFFPKWLSTLHQWLVHPSASFEEIAQWYAFWKGTFPENVQHMAGVERGFGRALELINKAIELGPDVSKLPAPNQDLVGPPGSQALRATPKVRSSRTQEITFKSIVEDFAASYNLLFIPAGKVEPKSRMPLSRLSRTADGKGGLLVYILDDAVWASDGDTYRAIGLEEMVLRANKH